MKQNNEEMQSIEIKVKYDKFSPTWNKINFFLILGFDRKVSDVDILYLRLTRLQFPVSQRK